MIESSKKFGKYTLLERLAVGGMAEIFKASAGGLDGFEKIVAIKRLHRQFSEDSDFATMLIDEAQLVVRLSHANIGQVFDLGCIDGQYFIVMEYIEGLDLHELAERAQRQKRQLPLEALVHVIGSVAEALHYAHTKLGPDQRPLDIVHRDVSPQNVMLSIDGEIKLVDFGIAKARMRVQSTQAGIIKGKFYYMSPEQALGHRIDARTDVYALGMVLYEILAGGHPFDRVPDGDLLKSVRMADFAPIEHVVPSLPAELAAIIGRALQRNADRRFGSALEFRRALKDFADRHLPQFSRVEMAELVRQYSAQHLPETTRAGSGFEVMAREHFTIDQDSVIFDTNDEPDGEFEEDQTRVFLRDPATQPDFEDLEADGETYLLDWASSDEDSGPGGEETVQRPQPEALPSAPCGPEEVDTWEREERAKPWQKERPQHESVQPPQAMMPPAVAAPRGTKIHQRLATGIVTRFDHLLRRRPHLVGAGLAALAVLLLGVAAVVILAPDASHEDDVDSWHASIADDVDEEFAHFVDLAVSTTPANADLFVDGRFAGKTPASVRELEIGKGVTLRFERDGYIDKELNLVIEPDMAPMVVRLEPLGGVVRVNAEPEGVEIFVNGNRQGLTPLTLMGLERDLSHEIEARYAGEVQNKTIQWSEEDERVKEVQFAFEVEDEVEEAAPAVASRSASSTPRRSTSAPRQQRRTQPAPEPTRVVSTGSSASQSSPSLNIWEIAEEVQQGRLTVRVNADRGRIYVDNRMVKDGTVLVGHQLDPGSYEVRVYFPTLKRHSEARRVSIRSGETTTITISP